MIRKNKSPAEICEELIETIDEYYEFMDFAFGEASNETIYCRAVPELWNKRHPDCPIKDDDDYVESILKMLKYWKANKDIKEFSDVQE